MKIKEIHSWNVSPREAFEIQKNLARQVILSDGPKNVETVAGSDIALDLDREEGIAGIIIYRLRDGIELERVFARSKISFPYIPGLLAFREGPILLKAFQLLKHEPDLVFFDGQGISHPRGLGIASHLGIILDKPTIGCAKSRLIGTYHEPGIDKGCFSPLIDQEKQVGVVLRTRKGVRPIFVSPGHQMNHKSAVDFVLSFCDGYRIPKPTREADRWVGQLKVKSKK
ncbi:MAG: endonuclease V [Chlamydiae bacterium]|nr:endonuclease V [Chlamydiota bacterium]MBI3278131.1 endonuclease V [Chlamydiota bacterium]